MNARTTAAERAKALQGQVQTIDFRVKILGAGEVEVPVDFPVLFIERPTFTCGGEFDQFTSPPIVAGQMPRFSAVVTRWESVARPNANNLCFVGAHVAVVTSGPFLMTMFAHLSFRGIALVDPISDGIDAVEGTTL